MQPLVKISLVIVAAAALGAACRGGLPPPEPPRTGDSSPGTRTDDAPTAPLAGDPITASGGTSILPLPPTPGGTNSGGSGIH